MMQLHEVAKLFPPLTDEEFADLKTHICENGLQSKIVVDIDSGLIIDGAHRYRALRELTESGEISLPPAEWFDYRHISDPIAVAVALNDKRRHLTTSQRAMVAAKIARLRAGDNQYTKVVAPNGATSQSEAAEMMSVSRRTVQRATQVLEQADPETVEAVESGELPVARAIKSIRSTPSASDRLKVTYELDHGVRITGYADVLNDFIEVLPGNGDGKTRIMIQTERFVER